MRLRIRTLSNEETEVQVEGDETVFHLKEKIEGRWANMPAGRQKLVHAGKILVDACKIKDCPSLKENDRLVVMVTKAVAPSAAPSSSSARGEEEPKTNTNTTTEESTKDTKERSSSSASSADAANPSTKTGDAEEAKPPSSSSAAAAPPSSDSSSNNNNSSSSSSSSSSSATLSQRDLAESALCTGPQLEETLGQLVAMGFPRAQAEIAMRAAYNNPDRAVEYLMNGMPRDVATGMFASAAEDEEEEEEEELPAEGSRGEGGEEESSPTATNSDAANPLAALRHHPAFNQIRQMIQTNPAMLPQVLQLIGSSNPQLLELISQNQDAFLEILQSDDQAAAALAGEGGRQPGSGGGLGGGGGIIQMTPEEIEALQRLEALGFSRHQAVEAYLACDRNEEMAANFLFENLNDEDLADERRD